MNPILFQDLENQNRILQSNFITYSNKLTKRNEKWDKFDKLYPIFKHKPKLIHLNVGGF